MHTKLCVDSRLTVGRWCKGVPLLDTELMDPAELLDPDWALRTWLSGRENGLSRLQKLFLLLLETR